MAGDPWQAKLDTYADGELSSAEMRALDNHLRGCPSCAADLLNRVRMKRAVQAAGKRYTPSAEFRRKIENKVAARTRPSLRWSWALITALALVLVGGAAYLHLARGQLRRAQVYSELADLHVATLASSNKVDVVSSDRHTVKPWFQGKIPFTFNLPELKDSSFVLVGGRVAYVEQVPSAQLIYQIRQHQISVFILQDNQLNRGLSSDSGVERRQSFNMDTWSAEGLRYFVVGDASPDDIRNLGILLKNAARV